MHPKGDLIQTQLRKFNLMGYAEQSAPYQDNGKKGKILSLVDGDWKYEDEFYGGEPYSGNETIWYKDRDIFRCVYWGKVSKNYNFSQIYDFLRSALKQGPNGKCLHRGPGIFQAGGLTYINKCAGRIQEFVQLERIYIDNKLVYKAHFIGGLINVER